MDRELAWIAEALGAQEIRRSARLQSLWSGYGEIFRVDLIGSAVPTAIVKWVKPPAQLRDARDSPETRSHRRKCRSYDVEAAWYRGLASEHDATWRVPALLTSRADQNEWIFVLEDLDALGFAERRRDPNEAEADACLAWLASFHAHFLGRSVNGLWKAGTYWHLGTRPDELAAVDDRALREAAPLLDRKLAECTYRTLVHGDAKPANFCFAPKGRAVAAVDFQYVGGGCGMKDVAYFLAGDDLSDKAEARQLDRYFTHLRAALARRDDAVDADAIEREWRALYPIAYADFCRFLAGWSKARWQRDARGQRITQAVLQTLAK
ncbi:MAG: phosphotransferase [Polyangiaceae bacterium]